MRRFKFGWVLVAAALLAIGIAIAISRPYGRWDTLGDRDRGPNVEVERLSKRAPAIKDKSLEADQSETAAILKQLAPVLPESGQAAKLEDPKTRKEPIRIKTH